VTRGGVERTIADPIGAEFPWRPPHPKAALEDGPLLSCGARDSNEPMLHEELRHCFKGIYFSAHWVSYDTQVNVRNVSSLPAIILVEYIYRVFEITLTNHIVLFLIKN